MSFLELKQNKNYFDQSMKVAHQLYKQGLYDDCCNYLHKMATFGWRNFTGYYFSSDIETLLNKIGSTLPTFNYKEKKSSSNLSILHIASELYKTGGHSRLIYNWIKENQKNNHTILSTWQKEEVLKEISSHYDSKSTYKLVTLPDDISKIEKSIALRKHIYENNYNLIILHIHPNDVIPILALSDSNISTPVLFLNHADHTFWIGNSIIDGLIQIRESNIKLDKEKRRIDCPQYLLPIPVVVSKVKEKNNIESESTKKIILLSTGTEYKYKPNEEYNFFKEAHRIVTKFTEVIIYIAGVNNNYTYYQEYKHERVICLGVVTNLEDYEDICDLYIEGFPTTSFTALLQPALKKKPFILHYNPKDVLKIFDSNVEKEIIYPINVIEWRQRVDKLIEDRKYREDVANKQFSLVYSLYSMDTWGRKLNLLYENSISLNHTIKKLSKNIFLDTINEQILIGIDSVKINHFDFTHHLNLWYKFIHYINCFKNRNKNVVYKNKLYKIKNILKRIIC